MYSEHRTVGVSLFLGFRVFIFSIKKKKYPNTRAYEAIRISASGDARMGIGRLGADGSLRAATGYTARECGVGEG